MNKKLVIFLIILNSCTPTYVSDNDLIEINRDPIEFMNSKINQDLTYQRHKVNTSKK